MQFGVITACYKGDYFLVKATCASIRHFLPDVPICVIADGDFSLSEIEQLYGVKVLRVQDSSCPELRRVMPGTTRSKFLAFWECPFETFIYLDSDALIWGDPRDQLNLEKNDFISFCHPPSNNYTAETIKRWHFNPFKIEKLDPEYEWAHNDYFCAGAFAARRGAIRLEDYLLVEEWWQKDPGVFPMWDQGMLNYLVYKGRQSGRIQVTTSDFQYIVPDHSMAESRRSFPLSLNHPPTQINNPCIIHCSGRKPLLQNLDTFSRPFTAFRLAHYRRLYGSGFPGWIKGWIRVLTEETVVFCARVRKRLKRI